MVLRATNQGRPRHHWFRIALTGPIRTARFEGSRLGQDGLLSRSLRGRDHDVAVVHRTVNALEQQRPGVSLSAIDGAAGDAWNLPVAVLVFLAWALLGFGWLRSR